MSAYANVDGYLCNCTEIEGWQASLSILSQLKQGRNGKRALPNTNQLDYYLMEGIVY